MVIVTMGLKITRPTLVLLCDVVKSGPPKTHD
jgi:hypothetical protein